MVLTTLLLARDGMGVKSMQPADLCNTEPRVKEHQQLQEQP